MFLEEIQSCGHYLILLVLSKIGMKKLLHSLRYGVFSHVWAWFSIVTIRVFGPKFAAYLSYLSINWGKIKEGPIILCLYRESFIKDITELRKRTALNYPIVMGGFTRFQKAWLAPNMQEQTFYQKHLAPNSKGIKQSVIYARHLISLVEKKQKKSIDGVLSANFDYWQDAAFKIVCKDQEIPFLVLSREHPIIPQVCDFVIDRYKQADYHFSGTAIAVAGKSTKEVIIKSETICLPEQVFITGLPRYDAWLDVDTSGEVGKRPLITLLTFTKGYYADQTFLDVLQLFCEAAEYHSKTDVKFLVKTKDAADTQMVKHIVDKYKLDNLRCDHEVGLFEVLPKSRMVINYNSLSLVEAVMAKAWIAIPVWGQCVNRGGKAMYAIDNPKVERLITFVESPELLMDTITACVEGLLRPMEERDVHDFVSEYIHVPDSGSYCQEFERFVIMHTNRKN